MHVLCGGERMIINNCLFCEKSFITYPCYIKKGGGKYCSKKCFGKHMETSKATFIDCATCGKSFKITKFRIKNSENNYCSYKCSGQRDKTGSKNPRWKDGKIKRTDGRVAIYAPTHPDAVLYGGTHILEYRLIAEKKIGRRLKPDEIVHHKDGNPKNNDLDNLEAMLQRDHAKIHFNKDPKTGRFIKRKQNQ